MSTTLPAGVTFAAPIAPRYAQILSPEAIAFIVRLQRSFNARRKQLLAARAVKPRSTPAPGPTSCLRRNTSANPNGPSRHCPPTCSTAAPKSPARSTAR
jgi:hypothetical protein